MSRINECLKKDINIEDYFTATHEWTVTLTKDFVALSQNGLPLSRWNIATDSSDDNDLISCEMQWSTTKNLTKVRLALMGDEFNKESWFYTSWKPAGLALVEYLKCS